MLCTENNISNQHGEGDILRTGYDIISWGKEANQASSKKDFRNKIKISQKEANESKHWLRMISTAQGDKKEECKKHWQEAHELTLIFAKISKNTKDS
ncbi:MAG: four helix bundle protein [Candidatus Paceibacterota bacterium]|jgi:four helix bundle protein